MYFLCCINKCIPFLTKMIDFLAIIWLSLWIKKRYCLLGKKIHCTWLAVTCRVNFRSNVYITEIVFHLEIAKVFAYVGHSFANCMDLKKKIVHIFKSLKFFPWHLFNILIKTYIGIFTRKFFFERYINLNFW